MLVHFFMYFEKTQALNSIYPIRNKADTKSRKFIYNI